MLYVTDLTIGQHCYNCRLLQYPLHLSNLLYIPLKHATTYLRPYFHISYRNRKKSTGTLHSGRAQKKTFRLPKTPLGAKNTIPVAFKPIPGTDRPRPWEPETSKKHQEQKTPFQEQKTRNPIFPLYFQKCESASAFKHGMSV